MKIVVIGGTGLIGSKVFSKLREHGHEGVNIVTGEELAEVLKSAPPGLTPRSSQNYF